jgi:hypothetical protein
MKKVHPLLVALLILAATRASATTLTGTITDAHGTNVTGHLYFTLAAPATLLSTGGCGGPLALGPGQPIHFTLTNGSITAPGSAPYTIYGNDCMSPTGTYYRMEVRNSEQGFVLRKNVQITGATVNIGSLTSYAPLPPSAAIGGDVTGSISSTTVVALQNNPVATTAPSDANVLAWSAADTKWEPTALATAGGVTGTGANTRLAYWTGTSTVSSNSGFTFDGTKLSVKGVAITGTAGAGYVDLVSAQSPVVSAPGGGGWRLYAGAGGSLDWITADGYVRRFITGTLTNDRWYTLPDLGGNVVIDAASQNLTNKTVNGLAVTTAASCSGSCTAPAICLLNTSGGTFYVCQSGSWVSK